MMNKRNVTAAGALLMAGLAVTNAHAAGNLSREQAEQYCQDTTHRSAESSTGRAAVNAGFSVARAFLGGWNPGLAAEMGARSVTNGAMTDARRRANEERAVERCVARMERR